MISATGVRIGWADLPLRVRGAVERSLGSRVVAAVSQHGGFSPGTADRVVTADGQRAFVKAVGCDLNEGSVALHRIEARVAAALPSEAPAPRLLACHDDGEWIALVFEDVDGRHPRTPWSPDEVSAVFATLADLAQVTTPCQALVHGDLRADNLLLRADGTVAVVDWPHACRGPAWLDRLLLCINFLLYGDVNVDPLVAHLASDTGVSEELLIDVLTGYTGYFLDAARRPPPSGLPTVRVFQQAQADALLPWVRQRLSVQ
ncbi:MAG TPA: phosphotransferase [Micromonosporaceae bacterium]|nr:phosphotransferase [Micromonosporaceae bacterium]